MNTNDFLKCDNCKLKFTKDNYAVTLACGHNCCKKCASEFDKKNFICKIDKVKQSVVIKPSIEFMNLIENYDKCMEIWDGTYTYIPIYEPEEITEIDTFTSLFYNEDSFYDNRVICRFFMGGYCRYGNSCWNKHL